MKDDILQTFSDLVAIDAPARHEAEIAKVLKNRLVQLGFSVEQDAKGNLIGYLKGRGDKAFLLSAHMDRVPPGKGHVPVLEGDILKSNGETNLGADDVAGLVVILEALRQIIDKKLPHPPLVVVFTVEEEIGLRGASEMNMSKLARYPIAHGIVYDNAGKAGALVNRNPAYVTFTINLNCQAGHPGKDIDGAVYLLKAIQDTDWMLGESDDGDTRVNIGVIQGGMAWNVIPGAITLQGEVRSLDEELLAKKLKQIEDHVQAACKKHGATFTMDTKQFAYAYRVSEDEPLVQAYKRVLEKRGGTFTAHTIFITADTNVLRGERGLNVITLSTGTENDHTLQEWIRVSDMVMLTEDLVNLLSSLGTETG